MASESIQNPSRETSEPTSEQEQLAQVRSVLLGPQDELIASLQEQLTTLQTRIQDMDSRVLDTSEVLAASVSKAHKADSSLGLALKPIVVDKFHEVSREDPDIMAEALFPILGPAVRKMIVNIITPDKNGKKFGYQVEQLFVIDKNTGLPVCHVAADSAQTQDADMVSGMLSAIQSFVHDAFETDEFDGLNTLQMGDLSVWVEWGPQAVLAAVVRGAPPQRLREALQIKIEDIHHEHQEVLKNYDGDASTLDRLIPDLKSFLDSHDGSFLNRVKNFTPGTKKGLLVSGLLIVTALVWFLHGRFEQASWDSFITTLGAEPGVVITDQREEDGLYKVFGLRDEFAKNPIDMHKLSKNDRDVEFHFESYYSVHPDFIRQRAIKLLNPPSGVKVLVAGSTLYVSGTADRSWIALAKPSANVLLGTSTVIFNVRPIE